MNKASRRALGLAAILCATSCLSTPAWADHDLVAPPPLFSSVDSNGVDVITGDFHKSAQELSIGPQNQGGLSYIRSFVGTGWTDNFIGVINETNVLAITNVTISLGGTSAKFVCGPAGCASFQQDGSTLVVDSSGYTFTNSTGAVAVFTRNSFGEMGFPNLKARISSLTFPSGYSLNFTYKEASPCGGCYTARRLQSVTSNTGYHLKFQYDINDNNITSSQYDSWTHRKKVMAFNTGVFYCDPTALSCADSAHSWPALTYSPQSATSLTVTDPESQATTYTYDSTSGKITRIHRPGSAASDDLMVSYDSTTGRVTKVANGTAVGAPAWTYVYSDATIGGVTTRTTVTTDPNGFARTTTSDVTDPDLQLVKTDRKGSPDTTSYDYDSNGRLTKVTHPEGDYVQYTYDSRGNVTETRIVSKTGSGSSDIVTTASFSGSCSNPVICNHPTSTTDANGYRTDYTYDSTHGGITAVTLPAPSGATPVGSGDRPETRFSYTQTHAIYRNSSNVLVSGPNIYVLTGVSACSSGTAAGSPTCLGTINETKTTIAYANNADGSNNLLRTSSTQASGNTSGTGAISATTTSTYDAVGNLTSSDGPVLGSADTTNFNYGGNRELTDVIGPDPDSTGALKFRAVHIDYSGDRKPTAVKSGTATSANGWSSFAALQELDTDYDGVGRKIKDTLKVGGVTQAITQYSYDDANRPICTAIRLTLTPVPTDPCVSDTALLDRITRLSYNAADQIVKVKRAFNNPAQRDEATFTYTDNGHILTVADALSSGNGHITTFEYDNFDRISKVRFPNKTASGSSTTDYEQYTYDPKTERVTNIRRRDATNIGRGYDNLGRMVTKDLPGSVNDVTYGYNFFNKLTSAITSGQTLTFGYDALGRNISQTGPFGTVNFEYDLAGARTKMTWPGGSFYVNYDHDDAGEVTSIRENGATSGVGVLVTYVYDDMGRRKKLKRGNNVDTTFTYTGAWLTSLAQAVDAPNAQTLTFGNNAAGQITSRTSDNDAYAWQRAYDVDRLYSANGQNQYTTVASSSYTYDSLGNLTSDGSETYAYDNENHLITVGSSTLRYDPVGRLTKTTGAVTTQYLYDGDDLIAEYDGSGALLRRYVHGVGTDEPLVWYEGTGTTDRRWLIADQQGTIDSLTDSTGSAAGWVNSYDEYGLPASSNDGRFQYTGQAWLEEPFGLYYYKARIYSPTLGRFLQTDPTGFGGGMNFYAYVGNDAINARDPSGTDLCLLALSCCTEKFGVDDLGGQLIGCAPGTQGPHDLFWSTTGPSTGIPFLGGGYFGGLDFTLPRIDATSCPSGPSADLARSIIKNAGNLQAAGDMTATGGTVIAAAGALTLQPEVVAFGGTGVVVGKSVSTMAFVAQATAGAYLYWHGDPKPLTSILTQHALGDLLPPATPNGDIAGAAGDAVASSMYSNNHCGEG